MTALDERAEFVAMKLGFSDDKDPEAFSAAISELLWMQREARNAALEEAAKVADSFVDPDWPGDDQSEQARQTGKSIRALKEPA